MELFISSLQLRQVQTEKLLVPAIFRLLLRRGVVSARAITYEAFMKKSTFAVLGLFLLASSLAQADPGSCNITCELKDIVDSPMQTYVRPGPAKKIEFVKDANNGVPYCAD